MIAPGPRNSYHGQPSNGLCSIEMLQLRERFSRVPCDQSTWFSITFAGLVQTAASEAPY